MPPAHGYSPALWMLRFRIKASTTDRSKLELVSLNCDTETPVGGRLQVILDDAMKKTDKPFWFMARNPSPTRSMPPPLTVEINNHRYVLDCNGTVVQWFKEPVNSGGKAVGGCQNWFYGRDMDLSTIQEAHFLNWLQKYSCPMDSILQTRYYCHINLVVRVLEDCGDVKQYGHVSVWARADMLLEELFEELSGAKVDGSFGFRKVGWSGKPPGGGTSGELYTYSQSQTERKSLDELGWVPDAVVWLVPERIEIEV